MRTQEEVLEDIRVQIQALHIVDHAIKRNWSVFEEAFLGQLLSEVKVAPDIIHLKPLDAKGLAELFSQIAGCTFTRTLDVEGLYQWETELDSIRLVIYANESNQNGLEGTTIHYH